MTYTREQLIEAMKKYNHQYLTDSASESWNDIEDTKECAEQQINHLLSFINEN